MQILHEEKSILWVHITIQKMSVALEKDNPANIYLQSQH